MAKIEANEGFEFMASSFAYGYFGAVDLKWAKYISHIKSYSFCNPIPPQIVDKFQSLQVKLYTSEFEQSDCTSQIVT